MTTLIGTAEGIVVGLGHVGRCGPNVIAACSLIDDFARTVGSGFGTATSGISTYTQTIVGGGSAQVVPGTGQATITTTASNQSVAEALSVPLTRSNVLLVLLRLDDIPAGTPQVSVGVAAKAGSTTVGSVYIYRSNGTGTLPGTSGAFFYLSAGGGSAFTSLTSLVSGNPYWIRWVFADDGTTSEARIWQYGTSEPSSWTLTTSGSAASADTLEFQFATNAATGATGVVVNGYVNSLQWQCVTSI